MPISSIVPATHPFQTQQSDWVTDLYFPSTVQTINSSFCEPQSGESSLVSVVTSRSKVDNGLFSSPNPQIWQHSSTMHHHSDVCSGRALVSLIPHCARGSLALPRRVRSSEPSERFRVQRRAGCSLRDHVSQTSRYRKRSRVSSKSPSFLFHFSFFKSLNYRLRLKLEVTPSEAGHKRCHLYVWINVRFDLWTRERRSRHARFVRGIPVPSGERVYHVFRHRSRNLGWYHPCCLYTAGGRAPNFLQGKRIPLWAQHRVSFKNAQKKGTKLDHFLPSLGFTLRPSIDDRLHYVWHLGQLAEWLTFILYIWAVEG